MNGERWQEGAPGLLVWSVDVEHLSKWSSLKYKQLQTEYVCRRPWDLLDWDDLEKVRATIVEEGELSATWYKKNYLLANVDKFQTTVINPRWLNDTNTDKCGALKIHDQEIESADHIRLLGVDIGNHVTFSKYISETCKKASSKIAVITRFCNLLSTKANLKIYKSFVLPNLTYCHTVWHFCRESDSRKTERVQEKALRAIYKAKTETYEELFRRAELPSLRNRRMQDIMIYMYKVKHGLAPKQILDIFTVKATQNSLRNSDYLIPRFNTIVYGKHSLRYIDPVMWSKLSTEMRNKLSLNPFKVAIRKMDVCGLMDTISIAVIYVTVRFLLSLYLHFVFYINI